MVIIILTNQLTLTLAILILIFQSNVLTNSYFSPYPNYSFKSFDPPWRPRKSFITLTRSRRSFGEGRDGAGNGGKFGGRPWGSREAMARAPRAASPRVGQTDRGREPAPQRVSKASPRHDAWHVGPATSAVAVAVDHPMPHRHAWRDSVNLPRHANRRVQKCYFGKKNSVRIKNSLKSVKNKKIHCCSLRQRAYVSIRSKF